MLKAADRAFDMESECIAMSLTGKCRGFAV